MLAENVEHFRQVKADELIVSGEVTSLLLASAATDHGVIRIIGDLLTHDEVRGPDNLCSIELPVPRRARARDHARAMTDEVRPRRLTVDDAREIAST